VETDDEERPYPDRGHDIEEMADEFERGDISKMRLRPGGCFWAPSRHNRASTPTNRRSRPAELHRRVRDARQRSATSARSCATSWRTRRSPTALGGQHISHRDAMMQR
jgi:hypothetical protein